MIKKEEWQEVMQFFDNLKEDARIYVVESKETKEKAIVVFQNQQEMKDKKPSGVFKLGDEKEIKAGQKLTKAQAKKILEGKIKVKDHKLEKEAAQELLVDEVKKESPNRDRIKDYIKMGANPNEKDSEGKKPLMYAMDIKDEEKAKDICDTLQTEGAKLDPETSIYAAKNKKVHLVHKEYEKNRETYLKELDKDAPELSLYKKGVK